MNSVQIVAGLSFGLLMAEGLPLYYWKHGKFENFGDRLSLELVQRIVGKPIAACLKKDTPKLLAIGSVISAACTDDIIWGTGAKGQEAFKCDFTRLDVRAVRGPLTREFLMYYFNLSCPEVYGDPALLIPYFFPEFTKKKNPKYEYIIIPHYSEQWLFPRETYTNVVYPTEPWFDVIGKILDSKLVISGSLHGIIVAEAYGVPARLLRRVTKEEPLFKYHDYYAGTGRPDFQIAFSLEEALAMGGEPPMRCDLRKLYAAFPFERWPNTVFPKPSRRLPCL